MKIFILLTISLISLYAINPIMLPIKGVKVDTKAFLKSKYGKKLKAKTDKYKKRLKDKLKGKVNLDGLLNGSSSSQGSGEPKQTGPSNKELADALKRFMQ